LHIVIDNVYSRPNRLVQRLCQRKSARSGVFNGFGPHDVPDVLQPGMVYMVTKGIRNIQVFQLYEHAAGSGCISYFQQVLFGF
jgi:hypothetical protein